MDRQLALEILVKYKQEGSYLNLTLNSYFSRYTLTKEQKDLITRIVYGTVQNMLFLEYTIHSRNSWYYINVKTFPTGAVKGDGCS